MFWEIGQTDDGKKLLDNPQLQNSYGYSNNSPLTYSDPNGRCPVCIVLAGTLATYAPQIVSYGQTLLQPLAQVAVSQAQQDAQNGNYGMAFVGAMTVGKFPISRVPKGLSLGQNFGKLGKVSENIGSEIKSLDPHVIMRMEQRVVSLDLMKDVVSKPLVTFKQAGDRTLYLTKQAGVVLDNTGKAITTYTKNEFKPNIVNVLKTIKE